MKIGIVGIGYWGKIILQNIQKLGYEDITICDPYISNDNALRKKYDFEDNYFSLKCDHVFITTPAKTHYDICKYFLNKRINIFCEKPLALNSNDAKKLYDLAEKKEVMLFTDWIFTFHSHIKIIKRNYEKGNLGKIKSVIMNRLNKGPERTDVSARIDLASHDISIIQYIFNKSPRNIHWADFKRNENSEKYDSALGIIDYDNFFVNINVSWEYPTKSRICIFEFEDCLIYWDDNKPSLKLKSFQKNESLLLEGHNDEIKYDEPLGASLKTFFSGEKGITIKQKKLTLQTLQIIESKY